VQASLFVLTSVFVLVDVAVDRMYTWLDPPIRGRAAHARGGRTGQDTREAPP
jgi:hypothetical protein